MRKGLIVTVSCSCLMLTARGALAESTNTAAVQADTKPLATPGVSAEPDKNPYSKADGEWHAYLNRCGYEVGSEGKLIRSGQRRQQQGQRLGPSPDLAEHYWLHIGSPRVPRQESQQPLDLRGPREDGKWETPDGQMPDGFAGWAVF